MKFAETRMPEYDIMHSTYIPSKAEMLNNVSTHGMAPDVPLLFLIKRCNAYAVVTPKPKKTQNSPLNQLKTI